MKTSAAGRSAITRREGNKLVAYRDSVNVLTIGIGHTSAAGPPKVTAGMKITAAESDEILSRDLAKFEAAVNKAVKIDLSQNEFDALVSLAFNIGGGAFAKSTLVRKLNAGDRAGAAAAFLSWNKAGGKTLPGLTTRRKAEWAQFLSTASETAPKPQPKPAPGLSDTATVRSVQQKLRDLGYPEVGDADGKTGTKTTAGILAFRADNGLPLTPSIDTVLLAALMTASPRPVSPSRATATKEDLKEKSPGGTVAGLDWLKKIAITTAGGSLVGGAFDIKAALDQFKSITDTLGTIAPWALLTVGGIAVAFMAAKFIRNRVEAYREGRAL
jgi:lysozyme